MGLAEGMTARNQRHGLFVVHGHASKGLANVHGCGERIRIAVRALRIDVNQAHLHRSEGVFEVAHAGVAFVTLQPYFFRPPVDVLFRFPDVRAAAGETEGLEAHRLQRNVTRENDEVGP